ncbi:MAG: signal peptide peptidase SppA [Spirochaetia bacterium]|nr:signal peptide peptidase SppA [Spirochaetia bacterium]
MNRIRFWILAGLFFVSISIGLVSLVRPSGKGLKSYFSAAGGKGIAVLEIFAPIYLEGGGGPFGSGSGVRNWIEIVERAATDPEVAGLLIRINSPGGTVGASQELFEALKRFRKKEKKIVVSVVDLCASGAYYISLPADKIVANPGSLIGSIGVIISSPEFSELLGKLGIRFNTLKSGEFKDILSPSRQMSEAERASLQAIVDVMYRQFLGEVISWRVPKSKNPEVETLIRGRADGRVLSAEEALRVGLIDSIGDGEKAKKELALLCGIPAEKVWVKRYSKGFLGDMVSGLSMFNLKNPADSRVEYRFPGF